MKKLLLIFCSFFFLSTAFAAEPYEPSTDEVQVLWYVESLIQKVDSSQLEPIALILKMASERFDIETKRGWYARELYGSTLQLLLNDQIDEAIELEDDVAAASPFRA